MWSVQNRSQAVDNVSDNLLSLDEECDVTAPEVEVKLAQFVDNRLVTPQSKEKRQLHVC